jgi:hypothetical protein
VTTAGAGTGGANEVVTMQSGLIVDATLYSELPQGVAAAPMVAQGGLTTVQLRNLDYRENPFDPLSVRPAGGIVWLLALTNPPATILNPTTYGNLALVDALAPKASGLAMELSSMSPLGTPVLYVSDPMDPLAPQVTATTPSVLNAAQPVGNQVFNTTPTVLYKFTSPADNYVTQILLNNLGIGLLPGVGGTPRVLGYMAPTTGRFADGLPFDTSNTVVMGALTARNVMMLMPKMGDYYFALFTENLSTSAAHTYTIEVKTAIATAQTLKEPPGGDSAGTPLATITPNGPYYSTNGAIDSVGDVDYIKVVAPKMGRLYASVQTPSTGKIGVGIFAMDCTTVVDNAAMVPTPGAASQEAAVSAGTTYCVKVAGPATPPVNPPFTYPYQLQISQDLP